MRRFLGQGLFAIGVTAALFACITPVAFEDSDEKDKAPSATKEKADGGGATASSGSSSGASTSGSTSGTSGSTSSGSTSGSTSSTSGAVDSGADTSAPPPTPCAEDKLLAGAQSTTAPLVSDNVTSNEINAFPYLATASTSAQCFRVFVVAGTPTIRVGVYSDNAGSPSTLMAQGTITTPVVGQWNKAVLSSAVPLTAGGRIWLAVIPTTSEFDIMVNKTCTGRRRTSNANGTLATTFNADPGNDFCDAAMYVSP
jgi:hypothetical protein